MDVQKSQKFCEGSFARVAELVLGSPPAATPGGGRWRRFVKRGFLFGLGSFLIVSVIGGLSGALIGTARLAVIITALICIPLSVFVIRRASLAPPHRSRLHAVFGWLLGFLAIDAAIFVAIVSLYHQARGPAC